MAPTGYTRTQILLHWVVVVLLVLQFAFHEGMEQAFEAAVAAGSGTFSGPAIAHMAVGGLILILMVLRLIIKRERGAVPPPEGEPALFATLSKIAHGAFYVLLLALPLGGAIAWGGLSEAAGNAHDLAAQALFALIIIHIGAVLVHQFVWKTGLLRRMLKPEETP